MRYSTTLGLCLLPTALLLGSCGSDKKTGADLATGGAAGIGGTIGVGGGDAGGVVAGGGAGGNGGGLGGNGGASGGAAGATGGGGGTAGTPGGGAGGAGGHGGTGGNGGTGGTPNLVYSIIGCAGLTDGGAADGGFVDAGLATDAAPGDAGSLSDASLADSGSPSPDASVSPPDASPTDAALATDASDAGGAFSATFTIFDAQTDQAAPHCSDLVGSGTIAITGAAPLTVAANISGVVVGSVAFTYDGMASGTHNTAPYAVAPDNAGDFQAANPPLAPGDHTIAITVYSLPNAMGTVLGQASIVITVVTATDAGM
ncbi:MAG TPA: hypothetical protein VL137_03595 [Polyangiaceae bacterium]|nr:hypothetical protein [Polyangiaceae bacterium]